MAHRINLIPRRNTYDPSSSDYSDNDIFALRSPSRNSSYGKVGSGSYMKSSPSRTYRRGNYSPTSVIVSNFHAASTPTSSTNKRHLLKCKTELCTLFPNCPWGSQCHFAHGVEDLKRLPLLQLARFGLIFVSITEYRVRACPTWVMTGVCPFGGRCDGLHDPRIGLKDEYKSMYKAWLPHKDKCEFIGEDSKSAVDTGNGLYVSSCHYEQMACKFQIILINCSNYLYRKNSFCFTQSITW